MSISSLYTNILRGTLLMIDFEKLAEAYDLAYETNHCLSSEIRMIEGAYACSFHLLDNVNKTGDQYFSVDALLAKLSEKKFPASKYKVGQTAWRLNDEYEPHSLEICDIDMSSDEMYLDTEDGSWWTEEQLYPTREALIKAQLLYWELKLLVPIPVHEFVCQHGSFDKGDMLKCFHCGELYR